MASTLHGFTHTYFADTLTEAELLFWIESIVPAGDFEARVTLFGTRGLIDEIITLVGSENVEAVPPADSYGLVTRRIVTSAGSVVMVQLDGPGKVGFGVVRPDGLLRGD